MRFHVLIVCVALCGCDLGSGDSEPEGPDTGAPAIDVDGGGPAVDVDGGNPGPPIEPPAVDAGPAPGQDDDSGTSEEDAGVDPAPLEECENGSIDRFEHWIATDEEGVCAPLGSILVPEGDGYAGEVSFTTEDAWHVLVVWLQNEFDDSVDLSGSRGFTITYSATADLYIQLRPGFQWGGGNKWVVRLPATGGEMQTHEYSFQAEDWTTLFGEPPHTFDEAIADARGFVFVGNGLNELRFESLRIDGFTPPCKGLVP